MYTWSRPIARSSTIGGIGTRTEDVSRVRDRIVRIRSPSAVLVPKRSDGDVQSIDLLPRSLSLDCIDLAPIQERQRSGY